MEALTQWTATGQVKCIVTRSGGVLYALQGFFGRPNADKAAEQLNLFQDNLWRVFKAEDPVRKTLEEFGLTETTDGWSIALADGSAATFPTLDAAFEDYLRRERDE